jgi:hypothetical protein
VSHYIVGVGFWKGVFMEKANGQTAFASLFPGWIWCPLSAKNNSPVQYPRTQINDYQAASL